MGGGEERGPGAGRGVGGTAAGVDPEDTGSWERWRGGLGLLQHRAILHLGSCPGGLGMTPSTPTTCHLPSVAHLPTLCPSPSISSLQSSTHLPRLPPGPGHRLRAPLPLLPRQPSISTSPAPGFSLPSLTRKVSLSPQGSVGPGFPTHMRHLAQVGE